MKKKLQKRSNIIGTLLITCLLFMTTSVSAQVTYNGNSKSGFGGAVGESTLDFNDDGTTITGTFTKGTNGDLNDAMVIYISTASAGRSIIDGDVNDEGDGLRRAISSAGANTSDITFPAGFEATHAIAVDTNFGGLFSIPTTGLIDDDQLVFVDGVGNPAAPTDNSFTFSFDYSEIGLNDGDPFTFVVTYLNAGNGFLSNEGYGDGLPGSNPGANNVTFETYFDYPSGNVGGLATTTSAGNWLDASTWTNGNVPFSGDDIEIDHDVTLNVDAEVSNITISTGNDLTSESGQSRTLTIQDGGTFTNNGTFTANDGSVSFPGTGTISGTTTFNNVDIAGGVDFGSNSKINGTLAVNAGGFANTAPTYGASSTLNFSTGGAYAVDGTTTLWTSGNSLGEGVPNNIQVTTTNPLNIFDARDVTGNLTIDSGASVVQGNNDFIIQGDFDNSGTYSFVSDGSSPLTVQGNFNNQSGANFALSNTVGGDLDLEGNFTDNGTFTANDRAVFFTGSGSDQTITSTTDPLTIDFIVIDKPSSNVKMLQNLDLPNNLELTNGNLDVSGNTLTISGDIRPDGGSGKIEGNAANSTLVFDDSSIARTLEPGDLLNNEIANLTIDESAGVIINTDLTVTENLDINAGDNFIEGGFVLDIDGATVDVASVADFTFGSNLDTSTTPAKASTAQLAQITTPAGTTVNGDVTVERFIPVQTNDTRAYRFLTSTVDSTDPIFDNWQEGGNSQAGLGTHITGDDSGAVGNFNATTGIDYSFTGDPSMYTFDNSNTSNQNNAWQPVTNTKANNLIAGEAYRIFIRGDRNYNLDAKPGDTDFGPNSDVTLRATGSLVTGDKSFNLSQEKDFFSLVGNPYQARVDVTQVLDATNSTNVNTNFYYIWDPNLAQPTGDGASGAYVAVDLSGGTTPGSSAANQFVQPGQSFFVQTASAGAADITFTEAAKSVNQASTAVFNNNNPAYINLKLYQTANFTSQDYESDALQIEFGSQYTNAATVEDAGKLGNPGENLARLNNNTDLLSIEKREMPVDGESLPLFTNGYSANDYTLVVTKTNLPDNVDAYLVDDHTGNQSLLSSGENEIQFTVDESIPGSDAIDRFSIDFDVETLEIDESEPANAFRVYPNPVTNGQVNLQLKNSSGEASISVYNMLGQRILKTTKEIQANGKTSLNLGNQQSGVYAIKVSLNGESFKQQIIIK